MTVTWLACKSYVLTAKITGISTIYDFAMTICHVLKMTAASPFIWYHSFDSHNK